jgi:hypothetical protein
VNVLSVTVFFGAACVTVEQWSQEMSLTSPWPIRIHTFIIPDYMELTNSCFFVEICFLPWHLTPMSGNRISVHNTPKKGNLPCVLCTVTRIEFRFTPKPSDLSDARNQGLSISRVRKGQLLSISAQNLTLANFNLQVGREG